MTGALSRSRTATAVGFIAVLLWSLLSLLTAGTGSVPPLQLTAMTMTLGGLVGALSWIRRPEGVAALRQPWPVWALGVAGLFGYHALYFLALRMSPPAEAGLFNYLWPLLIVLFSALLPGHRLAPHHVIGALAGFCGAALVFVGPEGLAIDARHVPGYAAALGAALVWSSYSVLSRRFAAVPSDIVVGYCLATAVLATVAHLALERPAWPERPSQWLCLVALGIGPVGAAFYAWDHGMKRGDVRVLGALSYAAPVLSTGFLVLGGYAEFTPMLGAAALLIAGGGLLAAKDLFARRADEQRERASQGARPSASE